MMIQDFDWNTINCDCGETVDTEYQNVLFREDCAILETYAKCPKCNAILGLSFTYDLDTMETIDQKTAKNKYEILKRKEININA